jgi:hypothetical protein
MEHCERCAAPVDLVDRTIVLSSDHRGEMQQHVYCSSACAVAPGTHAATTFEAIDAGRPFGGDGPAAPATNRHRPGRHDRGGPVTHDRTVPCPSCFEPVALDHDELARLADRARHASIVCASCGELLRLDGETGRLASVDLLLHAEWNGHGGRRRP